MNFKTNHPILMGIIVIFVIWVLYQIFKKPIPEITHVFSYDDAGHYIRIDSLDLQSNIMTLTYQDYASSIGKDHRHSEARYSTKGLPADMLVSGKYFYIGRQDEKLEFVEQTIKSSRDREGDSYFYYVALDKSYFLEKKYLGAGSTYKPTSLDVVRNNF